MKNLLQIANEKKAKLEATESVKLSAMQDGEKTILTSKGIICPTNELQKFENGFAFVSGNFASRISFQEALRLNRI